jgi:hypothetical protein
MLEAEGGDIKSCMTYRCSAQSCICQPGATHDGSSMMASTCLLRAMRIFPLKIDWWFDGGDDFCSDGSRVC